MSVDLNAIAGSFKCSVEEVKMMLVGIMAEVPDYVAIIEGSIDSEDYGTIAMAADMIKGKINYFNLTQMQSAIDSLASSAGNSDKGGCASALTALKSAMGEIQSLL